MAKVVWMAVQTTFYVVVVLFHFDRQYLKRPPSDHRFHDIVSLVSVLRHKKTRDSPSTEEKIEIK